VPTRKAPKTEFTVAEQTRGGIRKKQRSTPTKQTIGIGRNGKRRGRRSPTDEARNIIQAALDSDGVMHTTLNELTRYELQQQLSKLPPEQYKQVWENLPEQLRAQLTFPVRELPRDILLAITAILHTRGEHRTGWVLGHLHPYGAPEWARTKEPLPSGHVALLLTWKNPKAPLNEQQLQFDLSVWETMKPSDQQRVWEAASLQNKHNLFSQLAPEWRAQILTEYFGLTNTKFTTPTDPLTQQARNNPPDSLSDALEGLWRHANQQGKQTILTNAWLSPELNNLFTHLQITNHPTWQRALRQTTMQNALNTVFIRLDPNNPQHRAHRAIILTNAWPSPELNNLIKHLQRTDHFTLEPALDQPTLTDAFHTTFEQLDPNNPQRRAHRAAILTNVWLSPELNNLFTHLQRTNRAAFEQALDQPTLDDALHTTGN